VPAPYRSQTLAAIGLSCATLVFSRDARANGRFPNAQSVRELEPGSLVVAGTYGLLVTTNGGSDFAYVCESEMFGASPGDATMDPLLELAPDGSFVTGSLQAARVSRRGGCEFETIASLPRNYAFFAEEASDGAAPGRIADLARRGAGAEVPLLALAALVDEAGLPLEHRVYEARSGTDFSPIGAPIPRELVEYTLTIDAAPSDPNRFYVTGARANDPVLVRSSDGGERWEALDIRAAEPETILGTYLGAVSASDPERIYVRVSRRRLTENGYYMWDDSLLVSDDAGDTFSEPLRRNAALLGFALANDGETVLAGYGEPRAEPAVSARDVLGIYAAPSTAPAAEMAFERIVTDLDVTCLHANATGLYACATEVDPLGVDPAQEPDFHLGVFGGAALPERRSDFAPLLKLRDVRGPPPQADGSRGPCETDWQLRCAQFFACENDPRDLDEGALVCGSGGAGGGAGGREAGDAARSGSGPSDAGCGCRYGGDQRDMGLAWMFAFLAVWWHRFRQKCPRSNF
jgi:hypothetical protein